MPAKKYYWRKKIEADFFKSLDSAPIDKVEDYEQLFDPLIKKYGAEAVEDFWRAKIKSRRMGGFGRGRRRSEAQKSAIERDRRARLMEQTSKSERQKRNHRLIVLGAKLEAAARSAGFNSFQIANMKDEDWDGFFFDLFKNGTRRPSIELRVLLQTKLS